jgi:hypothetical protein
MTELELTERAEAIVKEPKQTQAISITILALEYAQEKQREMLRVMEQV